MENHVKHVLKNSHDETRFNYYIVGTYLENKESMSLTTLRMVGVDLGMIIVIFMLQSCFFNPSKY